MNDLLVVYNTCDLKGKDNTDYYISSIRSILNQNFENFKLIVSDCCSPSHLRQKIYDEFKNQIAYNYIDTLVPVNVSFNHSVREGIKKWGKFSGYMYIDSGVTLGTNTDVLDKMWLRLETNKFGMVAAPVDNDSGFGGWFGTQGFPTPGIDFIVPLGKTCHLHAQIFHNDLLETYGNLMPDIFASYCTESTFSFLNAAIGKDFVIINDILLHHEFNVPPNSPNDGDGMDGHSQGFRAAHGTWDHTFKTGRRMIDICTEPLAAECGFGYEENRGVLLHNKMAYDENGHSIDPRLKEFIRDNIYLNSSELNYDKDIVFTFIG